MTTLASSRLRALAAPLAGLAGAGAAAAADLAVSSPPAATYDPFSGGAVVSPFTASIDIDGADAAILRIVPADGGAFRLSGDGPPLAFTLRSEAGAMAAAGALEMPIRPDDEALRFEMVLPASQYALAGPRTAELEAQLLDRTGAPLSGAVRFMAQVDVATRAQANIAGAAGVWGSQGSLAFIDFGELETGETATAALQVRATADVVITAWSDNHGRLVHLDPGAAAGRDEGVSVPYRFSLDGVSTTLAAPLVLSRPPAQTLDGVSYPILITLGNVEGLYAGPYLDTLNIDVTAR